MFIFLFISYPYSAFCETQQKVRIRSKLHLLPAFSQLKISVWLWIPTLLHFRQDDVREEANRGLKPQFENEADSEKSIGKYPSFVELCDYLHIKVKIYIVL